MSGGETFAWSSHFQAGGRIAYYHGRFQPFHAGHLCVVKAAYANMGAVAIGISNPIRSSVPIRCKSESDATLALEKARMPTNNPWPYWARCLMIQEALKAANLPLERFILLPNFRNTDVPPDDLRIPQKHCTVYIVGKEAHNRAAATDYRSNGWEVCVLEASVDVSGTEIRRRMGVGAEWSELVPAGAREFLVWYKANYLVT